MITKALVDSYALEIVARSRAAANRAAQLNLDDFISDSPKHLAQALNNTFEYLINVVNAVVAQIDWETNDPLDVEQDLRVLRVADEAVKYFAAHLRYVDSARTEKLPWEVIPSFEALVKSLHEDAQIMLRPMWHYNYATTVTNFRDFYLKRLRPFEVYLPNIDVESHILEPLAPSFHIVSFPALERENILLHSLIGHEVGHLVALRFLTPARVSDFLRVVKADVERVTDEHIRSEGISEKNLGELFFAQMRTRRITTNLDIVVSFWYRALEELLSDTVGAILFGPAALFSTMEMAVQFGFDEQPSRQNSFYPPWRMRLRNVLQAVTRICPSLFAENLLPWVPRADRARLLRDFVGLLETECSSTVDEEGIREIALARLAYGYVAKSLEDGHSFLTTELATFGVDEEALRAILPELVDRLDHGIPPNTVEAPVQETTKRKKKRAVRGVGIVEIINAAWFHKIVSAGEAVELPDTPESIRKRRNRLTLKAIEYSFIQREYEKWQKAPISSLPIPSASEMDRVLTEGVLTSPEIIVAMRRLDLSERLVVTPLLNISETIHDAAVDLRLGTEFVILKKQMMPSLNIAHAKELLRGVERYQQRFVRRVREEIVLHPGQLIIGSTLEYVQIPRGLMCYVIGKSTWGRTGLIIATATKIDPGFRGCVTLEIINEGEVPLVLVPGVPIAQLVLHRTEPDTVYKGVYSCPVGPEFPRFDGILSGAEFWLPDRE